MKKLIFLLCFLPTLVFAQPGYISTIAGTGTSGYTGDGGSATAARLNVPLSITKDPSGNFYVADHDNSVIRKISTSGIITTIAGNGSSGHSGDGGPATAAQIGNPFQLALDATGNLYFCEHSNNYVRRINTSGIITTIAGNGGSGSGGDGGQATAASFSSPQGLAIDAAGNIYIADFSNNKVRMVNSSGIISTFAGTGSYGYSGDGGAATAADMKYPNFLFIDHAGNLLISDNDNHVVRKVNTSGVITTFAGIGGSAGFSGDGGQATAAQLHFPCGVSEDVFNNIYIADEVNSKIRKVSPSGIITTEVGSAGAGYSGDGGPASAARIDYPVFTYFDAVGNLFICELNNSVIRKVGYAPQYVSDSFGIYVAKSCIGPIINIVPNTFTTGMYVKTYFSDSYVDSTMLTGGGFPSITHAYGVNGTYSIKHVLFRGIAIDSFTYSYSHTLCNAFNVNFYYDANSNCTKDTSDVMLSHPITIEVDSSGVPVDTISAISGLYYTAYGSSGCVYSFRAISVPSGFHVTCPGSGVIYDTISSSIYAGSPKSMAVECTTAALQDLEIFSTGVRTGVHAHIGDIYAANYYCPPVNATVTLRHSPKHHYHTATPAPASTTANSVTWNISSLTSVNGSPTHLYYHLETPGSYLTPGDTVNSIIVITPDTGDVDTSNNVIVIVDTVKAGFDPNAIYAKPAGCIAAGVLPTEMQYTITFENTGNDTAHNIYVMDTLPDYVDVNSMRLVMASHEMYVSKLKTGGHNIVKFDFPKINLRDSSHHGECDGTVIYTINTKAGLSTGTDIMHRVGIYFDVNDVVMTNEAHNVIGCPVVSVSSEHSTVGSPVIYPNPAYDILNIKASNETFDSYNITNSIGVTVATGGLAKQHTEVNIKQLPTGIYFVVLKGAGSNMMRKFVKL